MDVYKRNIEKVTLGELLQRDIWALASSELKSKGFGFNEAQCFGRWKTVVNTYNSIKTYNTKTGNKKRAFPSYAANLDKYLPQRGRGRKVINKYQSNDEAESDSDCSSVAMVSSPARHPTNLAGDIVMLLENFIEKQEKNQLLEAERQERRHREKMELLLGFLDVASGISK